MGPLHSDCRRNGVSQGCPTAYKNIRMLGFYGSFIKFISLTVCAAVHICVAVHVCHNMSVEPRRQPEGVSSLLPRGSRGSNLSHQAWQQGLAIQPPRHPMRDYLYLCVYVCGEAHVHMWTSAYGSRKYCPLRTPSTLFFETGLLIGLKLAKCSKLTHQGTPGIYLSLHPCV